MQIDFPSTPEYPRNVMYLWAPIWDSLTKQREKESYRVCCHLSWFYHKIFFAESIGTDPREYFYVKAGVQNFQCNASTPIKNTIIYFPFTRNLFSAQPLDRKNYSIVLSANEIAKCKRLKTKQKLPKIVVKDQNVK